MEDMPAIARIFIALLILSALFWLVEYLFSANPAQKKSRKDLNTDLIYWFITPLISKNITRIAIGLLLFAVFQQDMATIKTFLADRDTLLSRQPFWLQAIGIVLTGDFVSYWMHRAFHRGWLWDFHAIHHSSVSLDWLSSVRLHPLNDLLMRIPQVMAILALGFSPAAIAVYAPFLTFYAIMLHANVNWSFGKFGWLIASPVFHRWHHTAREEGLNKNFAGLIPAYDWLFGTYYMPKGRQPEKFGLPDKQVPDGFFAQMLYPFQRNKTPQGIISGGPLTSDAPFQ